MRFIPPGMTQTKLLIGQALIALAIMPLGFWTAMQWAAAMLGYQPGLRPFLPSVVQSGGTGHRACSSMLAIVHLRGNDADIAL